MRAAIDEIVDFSGIEPKFIDAPVKTFSVAFAEREANEAYEDYRARARMRNGRRFGAPPKPPCVGSYCAAICR